MKLDEKFIAQCFAELKEAQGHALGMLTQALCQQVNPAKLKSDLQKQIEASEKLSSTSPLAIEIALHAMAAAEAEQMLQSRPASEGPHPKREA